MVAASICVIGASCSVSEPPPASKAPSVSPESPGPGGGEANEDPVVPSTPPEPLVAELPVGPPAIVEGHTSRMPPPFRDPFAGRPDTSEGLTNVSADLAELLENGALEGACGAWQSDPSDRRKKLLCGKSMFFYEGFGTVGVPAPIFDFLSTRLEDQIGLAFSGYGLVPDPFSPEGRPLGAAPGIPMDNGVQTVAFNCASCHFGQLPDGRYAVGAPNHEYEYGKHLLSLMLLPFTASPGYDPSEHHPAALAAIQPLIDRLNTDTALRIALVINLLPLLGASSSAPAVSVEYEGFYASWRAGTMDFVMPPLPLDDEVHTVSKIIDLWDIPAAAEQTEAGMVHALLAWTGGAKTLMEFLSGFVTVGGGDNNEWTLDRLEPLHEYILSLRAPNNPMPPDAALVARGERMFVESGCLECHDGPRGSGRRWFTYEEIGTDDAMRYWADPNLTGTACCGFDSGTGEMLTHGIKAPRLTGLWAKRVFLHNGSLDSLDQLLCLDARPPAAQPPFSAEGHLFGCDLPEADRRALVDYLLSH